MFETLENRRLLAVTLSGGVLTVSGTEAADIIEVQNRSESGELKLELNGDESRYPLAAVQKIVINGLGGDDFIEYSGRRGGLDIPGVLDGGAGDDTLQGGPANDTINGGEGNDRIQGKGGDDVLSGGDGNDFIQGGAGDDSVGGGNGEDDVLGGTGHDRCKGGRGNDDFDPLDDRRERRDEGRGDRGRNRR